MIFFRVVWWSKKLKWSLKSKKHFLKPFLASEKGFENTRFFDFKHRFHYFDHQTSLKNIARILCSFCMFVILNTKKFVKISKTCESNLEAFLIKWDNVSTMKSCLKAVLTFLFLIIIFSNILGKTDENCFSEKIFGIKYETFKNCKKKD